VICDFLDADLGGSQAGPEFAGIMPSLTPRLPDDPQVRQVAALTEMDDEALHRALVTGRRTYWSRSRQEYWVKGESSGHAQWVKSVALDCDADVVLVKVDQVGAACHTGDRTCFDADVLDAYRAGPADDGGA
jgi:phosphoribosyl-AMP cyclohydrolase